MKNPRPAPDSVRPPQQARSQAAHDRIVDAVEALIETRPLESISVADIAGRAGVSIGNFYKRFSTKKAVLEALHARYESQRTEHLLKAFSPEGWKGRDLGSRARWIATTLVEMFRARRGLIRSFVMHHRNRAAALDDSMHRRLEDVYRSGAALLLGARQEIRHPAPERAARFGMLLTASLCRELILFKQPGDPGAVSLGRQALVDELTRVLVGYLRCGPSGARPSGRPSAARTRPRNPGRRS
jgi:AcrR family transcriptional regulator